MTDHSYLEVMNYIYYNKYDLSNIFNEDRIELIVSSRQQEFLIDMAIKYGTLKNFVYELLTIPIIWNKESIQIILELICTLLNIHDVDSNIINRLRYNVEHHLHRRLEQANQFKSECLNTEDNENYIIKKEKFLIYAFNNYFTFNNLDENKFDYIGDLHIIDGIGLQLTLNHLHLNTAVCTQDIDNTKHIVHPIGFYKIKNQFKNNLHTFHSDILYVFIQPSNHFGIYDKFDTVDINMLTDKEKEYYLERKKYFEKLLKIIIMIKNDQYNENLIEIGESLLMLSESEEKLKTLKKKFNIFETKNGPHLDFNQWDILEFQSIINLPLSNINFKWENKSDIELSMNNNNNNNSTISINQIINHNNDNYLITFINYHYVENYNDYHILVTLNKNAFNILNLNHENCIHYNRKIQNIKFENKFLIMNEWQEIYRLLNKDLKFHTHHCQFYIEHKVLRNELEFSYKFNSNSFKFYMHHIEKLNKNLLNLFWFIFASPLNSHEFDILSNKYNLNSSEYLKPGGKTRLILDEHILGPFISPSIPIIWDKNSIEYFFEKYIYVLNSINSNQIDLNLIYLKKEKLILYYEEKQKLINLALNSELDYETQIKLIEWVHLDSPYIQQYDNHNPNSKPILIQGGHICDFINAESRKIYKGLKWDKTLNDWVEQYVEPEHKEYNNDNIINNYNIIFSSNKLVDQKMLIRTCLNGVLTNLNLKLFGEEFQKWFNIKINEMNQTPKKKRLENFNSFWNDLLNSEEFFLKFLFKNIKFYDFGFQHFIPINEIMTNEHLSCIVPDKSWAQYNEIKIDEIPFKIKLHSNIYAELTNSIPLHLSENKKSTKIKHLLKHLNQEYIFKKQCKINLLFERIRTIEEYLYMFRLTL